MTNKVKRRLKNFDFTSKDAHVALVSTAQGGAASEWEIAVVKSAEGVTKSIEEIEKAINEVIVAMPFDEFLRRFFDMYWSDSKTLAYMLGYSPDIDEWDAEMIDERLESVVLLKAANEAEDKQEYLKSLSLEDGLAILQTQEAFELGLEKSSSDNTLEGNVTDIAKDVESMSEDKHDKQGDSQNMTIEEMLASEAGLAAIQKAANEAKDSEAMVELEKAKTELEELRKAKVEIEKAKYVDITKSLSFVDAEKQESFAEVLYKASSVEGFEEVLVALEKANKIAEEFGKPAGHEGEGETLTEIDKSRANVRANLKKSQAK